MKLGAGVTPVLDLLAQGIVVGLGTDGCAGNNDLDLFREMGTAARLHKVHRLDPTLLGARSVLEMATLKAAEVLGMEKEIGSLEVGEAGGFDFNQSEPTALDPPLPSFFPFGLCGLRGGCGHGFYCRANGDAAAKAVDLGLGRNSGTGDVDQQGNSYAEIGWRGLGSPLRGLRGEPLVLRTSQEISCTMPRYLRSC